MRALLASVLVVPGFDSGKVTFRLQDLRCTMLRFCKRSLISSGVVFLGLVATVPTPASAQWGWDRDAGSKARGEVVAPSRNQRGMQRSYAIERAPSPRPTVVAPSQAPADVAARGMTEQRRFSYSPAPNMQPRRYSYAPAPTATAPNEQPRTYRRYSYEPASPSFSTPARPSNRSRTPSYFLPKTDPGRFR